MRFESRAKALVVAGMVLLAASAAGIVLAIGRGASGIMLAASAAGAILAMLLARRGLHDLSGGSVTPQFVEVPAGVPRDMERLSAQLLQLESRVEHAPIALFTINEGAGAHAEPANIGARRLLAPGRVADRDDFSQKLAALKPGQRDIIEFDSERGRERALAAVNAITFDGVPWRLVAVVPVESELEAQAMEAWQQLIRVLTHEIMNSLTPVASLSQSARELLQDLPGSASDGTARELDIALDAIHRRAEGLIHFVDGYRSLASVPEARPERVDLASLFARLAALTAPSWQARGGKAVFVVEPETMALMIDPAQLEQALVNLLKNAEEATAEQTSPEVIVSARLTRASRLRVEIRDNGPGVPDEAIAHIFTPFFTTRHKGSGIGLAMVRQLVHRNGGTVRYVKSVGAGACFVISF